MKSWNKMFLALLLYLKLLCNVFKLMNIFNLSTTINHSYRIKHMASLDALRTLAALGVVFYHYFIFFFTEQEFSALLCCFPTLDFSASSIVKILKSIPFDIGKFSVALFFLISGFLIPFLLERYPDRYSFLKNRFFRLWPIYIIGLAINILFVWLACLYNQIPFPHTFQHIVVSLFCLRDFFGYPFITGVIWTFEIEVKFFLFCFIVYPLIKEPSPKNLLLLKGGLFFLCFILCTYLLENQTILTFFKIFSLNLRFFCFLFLGMYLSFLYQKKITFKNWGIFSALLITLFGIENFLILKPASFFKYILSYIPAWVLFVLCMWQKKSEDVPKKQFSIFFLSLAEISYPLYLIHAIPGYIIVYILYDKGVHLLLGIFTALVSSFLIAIFLHYFIELPIRNAWSRKNIETLNQR